MSNVVEKRPFKLIEISLNKFKEEVIPYHKKEFETHKNTVDKLIRTDKIEELKRHIFSIKKNIRQLNDLIYELSALRQQVGESDFGKFDSHALILKATLLQIIEDYTVLGNSTEKIVENQRINKDYNKNDTTPELSQIQLQEHLQVEDQYVQIRSLNEDIQDVNEIFVNLNQMVRDQREHVDVIENNVESSNVNVLHGLKHLTGAIKLKNTSYPIAGAVIGTFIGGPIGSVAGLKVGGLVAIGCGVVGYISGNCIKKINKNQSLNTTDVPCSESAGSINPKMDVKKDV